MNASAELFVALLLYVWFITPPWFAVSAALGYVSGRWTSEPWTSGPTSLLATAFSLWASFSLTIIVLLQDSLFIEHLWQVAAWSFGGVVIWSPFIVLLGIVRGLASSGARRRTIRLPDPNSEV